MAERQHLIGYARVSTDDQELTLQLDALQTAGVHPDDIYTDKASGAAGKRRPGLVSALKDCRAGDVLVVWKLDRLGRSLEELVITVRRLQEKGADLKVLTGAPIDTATPGGKLVFHIFAAMAEFERELIRERTLAGLAAARARGRVGGRKVKFTPAKQAEAKRRLLAGETIKAVAASVGVSKSTLHKHFPGGTTATVHDPVTCEVRGE